MQNLSSRLFAARQYRMYGVPQWSTRVGILTFPEYLSRLNDFVDAHPHLHVDLIGCFTPQGQRREGSIPDIVTILEDGRPRPVPVSNDFAVALRLDLECILWDPECSQDFSYYWEVAGQVDFELRFLWLDIKEDFVFFSRTKDSHYDPDFYSKNKECLDHLYSLLEDEDSRDVLAGTIKATMTNNNGYRFYPHPYPEYHNPNVKPDNGDIVIDGGVSDYVWEQEYMASVVGKEGKIFSFEPLPNLCKIAEEKLSSCENIELVNKGLSDKEITEPFIEDSVSSISLECAKRIDVEAPSELKTVECQMTTIDKFVEERNIQVNVIKLDVEGAELSALIGAEKTIREQKPKLIVCLYHKLEDLWELPNFIKDICPTYRMWMGHHSYDFSGTVLYAKTDA